MNGILPEGEFSISKTEPVLDTGTGVEREARFGLPLEPEAGILARKLVLRMYGNGDFVSRDLYDLCTAAEREGASFERQLSALPSEKRGEIACEITSYGVEPFRSRHDPSGRDSAATCGLKRRS